MATMQPPLIVTRKEDTVNDPNVIPVAIRQIEQWSTTLTAGSGYASLTGPGQTTTPGALTQAGALEIDVPSTFVGFGFRVVDQSSNGIDLQTRTGTIFIESNTSSTANDGGMIISDYSSSTGTGTVGLTIEENGSGGLFIADSGGGIQISEVGSGGIVLQNIGAGQLWLTSTGGNIALRQTGTNSIYGYTSNNNGAITLQTNSASIPLAGIQLIDNTTHGVKISSGVLINILTTTSSSNIMFSLNNGSGGAGANLSISGLPTSSAGLTSGMVWNNAGVLSIV